MNNSKWDVFISYSSKDSKAASTITDDLRNEGLSIWQDQSVMLPGERVREAIHQGIQNSACLLILISQNSLRSKWVINELDAAMLREMREERSFVIPVLLGKINHSDLPSDIQGKKYVDLRHNFLRTYQRHRNTLINAVRIASQFDRYALREEASMGNEMAAMLLTKDISNQYESNSAMKIIDDIIDSIFHKELIEWPEEMELGQEFLSQYGREVTRRLLIFTLEDTKVDFFSGFTEKEFDEAVNSFMITMWMTMARGGIIKNEGEDLKFGWDDSGKIRYRLAKPGS